VNLTSQLAPTENVEIHVKGYKGRSCLEAVKLFEQIVGEMKAQQRLANSMNRRKRCAGKLIRGIKRNRFKITEKRWLGRPDIAMIACGHVDESQISTMLLEIAMIPEDRFAGKPV